jgi:leader peptidase (prepilin peptidase) / N-methyltransferase
VIGTGLAAGWAAAGAAVVTALLVLLVLPRLPEPADGDGKPLYRDLATRRFALGCAVLAAVAAAAAWLTGPPSIQPLWWVLSVFGVLLAVIDARTTWLPLPLTRAAWLAMAAAAVVVWALAGGPTVVRAAAGAALAGLLFFLVWLISRGGIGFGDVRFAPLVGAATASHSWSLLIWALLLGSLAGATHGLVRLALRRAGPFPYAPTMLLGAYLAGGATWAG